jgi:ERCC4-type nuclease
MWTLQVDTHENTIRSILEEDKVAFESVTMPIGDFAFLEDGELRVIIERKTYSDLKASVRDGRWKEQKDRIRDNIDPTKTWVIYILEGTCPEEDFITTCALSTQLHNKWSVLHSNSSIHTVKILKRIGKKIKEDKEFIKLTESILPKPSEHSTGGTRKLKKKDNYTHSEILKSQLACIPGISLEAARKLVDAFPSFQQLYDATKETLKETKLNKTKLGPKKAESIWNFFHGSSSGSIST